MPHTQVICTPYHDHTFNNHPYISISKFSANLRATATYVGMLNDMAIIWSTYHSPVKVLGCGLEKE